MSTKKAEIANVDSLRERSCAPCQKTYHDLKSYQHHVKSWKHFQATDQTPKSGTDPKFDQVAASIEDASLAENQSSSEGESEEPIKHFVPSQCLFCTRDQATIDENLEHMQKTHGMFIPDREYLVDLESFVGYLFTVISEFNECLYCGRIKQTAEEIRQHMLDKSHCKLKSPQDVEYEDFYDYSFSDEGCQDDKNGKSPEAKKVLDSKELEIRLESGSSIGHRSQMRYFRQNPRRHDKHADRRAITAAEEEEETVDHDKKRARQERRLVTRGEGGFGMIGVSDLQKRSLRAVEKKMLSAEIRARNQYRGAVEKAANRQKHFRVSVVENGSDKLSKLT